MSRNSFTPNDIPCNPADENVFVNLGLDGLFNFQRVRFLAKYGYQCSAGITIGYPTWSFNINGSSYGPYDMTSIPTSIILGDCPEPQGTATTQVEDTTARATWNSVILANSYEIRFRTFNGVWSTEIPVGTIQYDFTSLTADTVYEWQVRSVCTTGNSAWSLPAFFKTEDGLCGPLYGFTKADIGSPSVTADICELNGEITGNFAGDGIGGTADSLSMFYKRMAADGEMIIRVTSADGSDTGASVGLMFRETLDADSEQASLMVEEGGDCLFKRRSTTGGSSANTSTSITFPIYLKLVRVGNGVTGHYSSDGISYTQLGPSPNIGTGANLYVGISGSHDNPVGTIELVSDNFSSTGTTDEPFCETPLAIQANEVTDDEAIISWETASQASSYDVEHREVGAGSWTGPTNSLTNSLTINGLSVSTDYEFRITSKCPSLDSEISEIGNFTTLATPPVASGTTINIDKVDGDPEHLELYSTVGFEGTIPITATFHVVTNCVQQEKKTVSTGIQWKDPLASFELSAGSAAGEYVLTDTSNDCNCPSGITSWQWTINNVEGTDWEFINSTNSNSQNPEIRVLKSNLIFTITLLVATACGSHQASENLLIKSTPGGSIEMGYFTAFVNGGEIISDDGGTAAIELRMYDGAGIPLGAGDTDYYYRMRFVFTNTGNPILDFWCKHNCNLKLASDQTGIKTDPKTLTGNEVIVNHGVISGSLSIPGNSLFATVAHVNAIFLNKRDFMINNGWACFVDQPDNGLADWSIFIDMYNVNDPAKIDKAESFITRHEVLQLSADANAGLGYDNVTESLIYSGANIMARVSPTLSLDNAVFRQLRPNGYDKGQISVLEQPDNPQFQFYISGPHNGTAVNRRGLRWIPSGIPWGSSLCEEEPYWVEEDIAAAGIVENRAIVVDSDQNHWLNGEPIYWSQTDAADRIITMSYYDGAAWQDQLDIDLTMFSFASAEIKSTRIDKFGRIWIMVNGALGMIEYTGASPNDPLSWVAGDFDQFLIAGNSSVLGSLIIDTDGASARWGATGLMTISGYDSQNLPIIYITHPGYYIVSKIQHSGTGDLSPANWNFTHEFGQAGVSTGLDGFGTGATFKLSPLSIVSIQASNELIVGEFGGLRRINLITGKVDRYTVVDAPLTVITRENIAY